MCTAIGASASSLQRSGYPTTIWFNNSDDEIILASPGLGRLGPTHAEFTQFHKQSINRK